MAQSFFWPPPVSCRSLEELHERFRVVLRSHLRDRHNRWSGSWGPTPTLQKPPVRLLALNKGLKAGLVFPLGVQERLVLVCCRRERAFTNSPSCEVSMATCVHSFPAQPQDNNKELVEELEALRTKVSTSTFQTVLQSSGLKA
ncbi:hypothetical protein AOLI_G00036380 [Acnodon oligacanthus]